MIYINMNIFKDLSNDFRQEYVFDIIDSYLANKEEAYTPTEIDKLSSKLVEALVKDIEVERQFGKENLSNLNMPAYYLSDHVVIGEEYILAPYSIEYDIGWYTYEIGKII